MTISFNEVPSNVRVPGAYVEIDVSRANNTAQVDNRMLVIGQRLSTGTVSANVPTLITSYAQAVTSFGQGSMLANMFKTIFDNNSFTEKWCVAIDDDAAGVAAVGTITITGAATESGTISLYLGGVLVSVSVAKGDVMTAVATAVAAAINANVDLPVTATVINDEVDNIVEVTYRHKGLVGNKFDMRLNYRGVLAGEKTPAGLILDIVQMGTATAGTTDPDLSNAIAALPDEIFNHWVVPYISSGVLDDLDTEMDSRWSPTRMLEGHVITADKGTVSALSTLGNSRNNQHMTIFDAANNSPTPPYLWAAAVCAKIAYYASIDPARPFNTLELVGVLAEPLQDRRTIAENNTLLYDGIATHSASHSGKVTIQRLVTTYQLNSLDVADAAYLDANTLYTLSYYRQSLRARITSRFPRHKLADDGTRFGAGQAIVTPKIIKAEIVALAKEWEEKGLIEDMDQFKADLIVERNADDRNRVDAMLPTNLVNQFHIFAAQISFIV
jgi:Mu-like prophage tail sheath protein gpL